MEIELQQASLSTSLSNWCLLANTRCLQCSFAQERPNKGVSKNRRGWVREWGAEGPHLSGKKWSLAQGIGTLWQWVGGSCSLRDRKKIVLNCGKYDIKHRFILIVYKFTYRVASATNVS